MLKLYHMNVFLEVHEFVLVSYVEVQRGCESVGIFCFAYTQQDENRFL